jgi:hypothetical protein
MGTVIPFPQSREVHGRRLVILENSIDVMRQRIFEEHKRKQTLAAFGYDVATAIRSLQALHQRLGLFLAERDRVRNALENQRAVAPLPANWQDRQG